MTNPISNLIAEKGWCVADGATGSNFFGRGLETGYPRSYGVSSGRMKLPGFTQRF